MADQWQTNFTEDDMNGKAGKSDIPTDAEVAKVAKANERKAKSEQKKLDKLEIDERINEATGEDPEDAEAGRKAAIENTSPAIRKAASAKTAAAAAKDANERNAEAVEDQAEKTAEELDNR